MPTLGPLELSIILGVIVLLGILIIIALIIYIVRGRK